MKNVLKHKNKIRWFYAFSSLAMYFMAGCSTAYADSSCIPTDILKDDRFVYNDSISTWLSFADFMVRRSSEDKSSSRGLTYSGVNLDAQDTKNLSEYYQRQAKYNLSVDQQTSILYTHLGDNRLQAYISCLKYQHDNFILRVGPGAQSEKIFELVVEWRPKYQVPMVGSKNTRLPNIIIANGTVLQGGGQEIAPDQDMPLLIERKDLDEPFSFVVTIDGKSSEILKFPRIPSEKLTISTLNATSGPIVKNKNKGKAGHKSDPYCIRPAAGSILLPSTAHVEITGGGNEWKERSKIQISEKSTDQVCFTLESFGEICEECQYYYNGFMSVRQATVDK